MKVAVVGGGPAGSEVAAGLAKGGAETFLFDSSFDREKPCGGGAPWRCESEFPHLISEDIPCTTIRRVLFEAPSRAVAVVELPHPLRIFSRRTLDSRLAARAARAGATLVEEKVVSVGVLPGAGATPGEDRPRHRLRLRTASGREETFDHIVGADGARSVVRRMLASPFPAGDLTQTVGCYLHGRTDDTARISFAEGLNGYLWSFPRTDHLAVGACAPLQSIAASDLGTILRSFLERLGLGLDLPPLPFCSALVPTLSPEGLAANRIAGEGWSLVGDAGGLVDPLTREGLHSAMKSASLAAEALLQEHPGAYAGRLQALFGEEMRWASSRRDRFFDPETTERLVRILDGSHAVRAVMADLVAGRQRYLTLKRRLLRKAVPAAFQIAWRHVLGAV